MRDVLTKNLGTNNPNNVVRATMTALEELRDPAERACASWVGHDGGGAHQDPLGEAAQIGYDRRQRATLRGLGLRRLQQTVELEGHAGHSRDDRQGPAPRRRGGLTRCWIDSGRTRVPEAPDQSASGGARDPDGTRPRAAAMKGQGHRSAGRETPLQFEGGQMPLVQRLPKRGFYSRNRTTRPRS